MDKITFIIFNEGGNKNYEFNVEINISEKNILYETDKDRSYLNTFNLNILDPALFISFYKLNENKTFNEVILTFTNGKSIKITNQKFSRKNLFSFMEFNHLETALLIRTNTTFLDY